MTTYNAKDLIEQAQMLADLQNSDFISWKENMMFLDNAWADLYQQIINHGDKTFLETFTFTGDRIELPDDFYQLYYVCYSDGVDRRPINRKAKTQNVSGPYYDLVGNELVIYNKMNSIRNIEVQYFPTRQSITYAVNDLDASSTASYLNGRYNISVLDVCDTKVLYFIDSERAIVDLKTGESSQVNNSAFMLGKDGYITDNYCPYFKYNNRVYYALEEDDTEGHTTLNVFKKEGGMAIETIHLPFTLRIPKECVNAMSNKGLYWRDWEDNLKYLDFDTEQITDYDTNLINSNVYSFDDSIYYEKNDGIYCNGQLIIPTTDYAKFGGVMKVDMKTGYGILVDKVIIKSAFPNTELDYPNNFYFNYLAYKLAVYYKIKQNADPSSLVALAEDALRTFYDTLPKDENEYVRIANVYAK